MPVGVSAYVPLATKTLTGTQASVTFSSISQAYRDLVLVTSISMVSGSFLDRVVLQFNGSTTNFYTIVTMEGDGATAYSFAPSAEAPFGIRFSHALANVGDGVTAATVANIFDYSSTDKHKTSLIRSNSATRVVSAVAGRWANTSAISSMTISSASFQTFAIGSTFTLYGVAA